MQALMDYGLEIPLELSEGFCHFCKGRLLPTEVIMWSSATTSHCAKCCVTFVVWNDGIVWHLTDEAMNNQ